MYITEKDENGREKSRTIISKGEVIFHQLLTYSDRNQVYQNVAVAAVVTVVLIVNVIPFIVVVVNVVVVNVVVVNVVAVNVVVVVNVVVNDVVNDVKLLLLLSSKMLSLFFLPL